MKNTDEVEVYKNICEKLIEENPTYDEKTKNYLKLWLLSSVDQSNRFLICGSCVRIAEESRYMPVYHSILATVATAHWWV